MRSQLLDIIKHTRDLKIIEKILVTTDDETTSFKTMDFKGNELVVTGTLKERIPEFEGQVGLSNLDVLKGYCNFPMFKTDDSKIKVKRKTLGDLEFPEELVFSGSGTKASYRCMLASAIESIPNFPAFEWDVDVKIPKAKILEVIQLSSILKETFLYVEISNGDLLFHIGDPNSSENHAVVTVASGITAKSNDIHMWNIQLIIQITKLFENDVDFKMITRGLINFPIETEFANYSLSLPRVVLEDSE